MTTIINGSSPSITFSDGSAQTSATRPFQNRIINGAMVIDQRNAGAVIASPADQYTLDRWFSRQSGGGVASLQQSSVAPLGFTKSIILTVTTADSSVTGTDRYFITQAIEGFNVADLGWGTANAQPVTISFWVRSSVTGTYGGAIQNGGGDRSYAFTYTISSANTWEQKTVTIAGDTTGTWATDNSAGIQVRFGLGVGSTLTTTAGSWTAGNFISANGATNWISTNGATFYITGVQLEVGSTATSFDYRPYGTELSLCQRYYQRFTGNTSGGDGGVATLANWNTTLFYGGVLIPTSMRSAPSLSYSSLSGFSYYANGGSNTPNSLVTNGGNINRFELSGSIASTFSAGNAGWLRITSSSHWLDLSAEL